MEQLRRLDHIKQVDFCLLFSSLDTSTRVIVATANGIYQILNSFLHSFHFLKIPKSVKLLNFFQGQFTATVTEEEEAMPPRFMTNIRDAEVRGVCKQEQKQEKSKLGKLGREVSLQELK